MTTATQALSIINVSKRTYPEYKSQSTCTDKYHRFNPFTKNLVATDGVMQMAEDMGAHWFLDIIASYAHTIQKRYQADDSQTFFVCRLNRMENDSALFTIDDGNDVILLSQQIEYTDAQENIRTYLQLGSIDGVTPCWVLMMPTEY